MEAPAKVSLESLLPNHKSVRDLTHYLPRSHSETNDQKQIIIMSGHLRQDYSSSIRSLHSSGRYTIFFQVIFQPGSTKHMHYNIAHPIEPQVRPSFTTTRSCLPIIFRRLLIGCHNNLQQHPTNNQPHWPNHCIRVEITCIFIARFIPAHILHENLDRPSS